MYDEEKGIVKTVTKEQGLIENDICSIVEDNDNNLWISANIGISKYNLKTEEFTNYNSLNGIGVWHEVVIKKLPQMGEYYDIRNMAILNAIHYEDWTKRQWKAFLMKWAAGNLLRGRYSYIYLNICAMLDFLKGEKWLEDTDGVEIQQNVVKRLPKLERLDKKEKNVFYTTPDVSVYTAARKKRVVYEDSAGLCLKADKNLAETIRLSIYLLLALRKTDRYFERARESYRKNWKKLITEEFWNNYLEIDKNE